MIWNRDLLAAKGRRVLPGEKIRHLTTAEEVSGASFEYGNWDLNVPYQAFDGKIFTKGNYRSDGTHPAVPTLFPNWDAEFRAITLYDSDNNL